MDIGNIENYSFLHGLHRNMVTGKWFPLHPHTLGRPLTHTEMDYNLLYSQQTLAGWRIFGQNNDLTLSDNELTKSLIFWKISVNDTDYDRYIAAGYTSGQYIWITPTYDCNDFYINFEDATDAFDPCGGFIITLASKTDAGILAPTPTATSVAPTPTVDQSERPTPTPTEDRTIVTPTATPSGYVMPTAAPTATPNGGNGGGAGTSDLPTATPDQSERPTPTPTVDQTIRATPTPTADKPDIDPTEIPSTPTATPNGGNGGGAGTSDLPTATPNITPTERPIDPTATSVERPTPTPDNKIEPTPTRDSGSSGNAPTPTADPKNPANQMFLSFDQMNGVESPEAPCESVRHMIFSRDFNDVLSAVVGNTVFTDPDSTVPFRGGSLWYDAGMTSNELGIIKFLINEEGIIVAIESCR